jgi:hypothetical protein
MIHLRARQAEKRMAQNLKRKTLRLNDSQGRFVLKTLSNSQWSNFLGASF